MDANLAAVIATQDAVILGRRSYTEWAEFWPSSHVEPFATFINGVTKYVATSTPLDRDWANATMIDGGLVDFVRELKQQRGGDVGVHASISVAQALLAADVVDELRLVIASRIAGRGRRLLDGLPSIQLEFDPRRDLTDWLSARRPSRGPFDGPLIAPGAGGAPSSSPSCGSSSTCRPGCSSPC
jgi:dihydrofolate reductase